MEGTYILRSAIFCGFSVYITYKPYSIFLCVPTVPEDYYKYVLLPNTRDLGLQIQFLNIRDVVA